VNNELDDALTTIDAHAIEQQQRAAEIVVRKWLVVTLLVLLVVAVGATIIARLLTLEHEVNATRAYRVEEMRDRKIVGFLCDELEHIDSSRAAVANLDKRAKSSLPEGYLAARAKLFKDSRRYALNRKYACDRLQAAL
jgi:hypothetical protein